MIKKENIREEIENKIIDCIALGAVGRLIIVKPEKNQFGADLTVSRKGNYKDKGMFFKINSIVGPETDNNFTVDFLQKDFKTDKDLYLIFAYFDEVKQKLNDYVWVIPSLKFRDAAEVFKSSQGDALLRFQAPLDLKTQNKYSRFLVNSKEIGKQILAALESGGKLDFKGTGFEEKNTVNLERLSEFISEARRNTYASNSTPSDTPKLSGSVQLDFQKGDFSYCDIFFLGTEKFIGQEIVYQNSKPIWGMNYIGNDIGKLQTAFLKESLFKLSQKCRLGQPCEYEKREYKYQDNGQGNLEDFSGEESICLSGKYIYKLNYRGGLI